MSGIPMQKLRPLRVVVLVEEVDGTQHAWETFGGAVSARWEWLGLGPDGTVGRMTAQGAFHRISKDDRSRRIEQAMSQIAIEEGRDE